jgi:hypothetical protein
LLKGVKEMLFKDVFNDFPDTLIKIYNDDVLFFHATGEEFLENMSFWWLGYPVNELIIDNELNEIRLIFM